MIRSDSVASTRAIQDQFSEQSCWGCGSSNAQGLHIKSYWSGDSTVCTWQPEPRYAGWPGVLNGGILASLVDCHCICTAISDAASGGNAADEAAAFATGSLTVNYLRPIPIDSVVRLTARITERTPRKTRLECSVVAAGEVCARAEVLAIRLKLSHD